ncbi:1,4-dihydroxy-2-naphthoate polyprenyltransferase [Nesterenkonia populi]
MATAQQWIAGSRPRTLPMAVAPAVIGAAAAFSQGFRITGFAEAPLADTSYAPAGSIYAIQWTVAVLALVVSLALQVGVNYANDYSDGVRGTDDERVGPMRLTGSGAASPAAVKRAAFLSFGVAGLAGLVIVALTGHWWLIGVGLVCILAAWWYTGGKKPYGYLGLGEVMVFIFFGLVATAGTAFAVVEAAAASGAVAEFPHEVWVGAVGHGLIASALLMANNIRDIPTDVEAGKRTLAVRLGQRRARIGFALMLILPVLLAQGMIAVSFWYALTLLTLPLAVRPSRLVLNQQSTGPALIPALQQTSILGLGFAATFSAALLLS